MKDIKISNELLNYVFTDNLQTFKVDKIENNILYYFWLDEGFYGDESNCKWEKQNINIYEFAFKCKEWAENKGYIIFSKNKECLIYSIDEVYDVIECLNQYEDYFEANTEIESIVKACNWILENIK